MNDDSKFEIFCNDYDTTGNILGTASFLYTT